MTKQQKTKIKEEAKLIFSISSPKGTERIEIENIFDSKIKEYQTKGTWRISEYADNIQALKEDACWNYNGDPEKFLIEWGPNNKGLVYIND